MSRDWSNHTYLDKYRSKKTGKWVYVYADPSRKQKYTYTDPNTGKKTSVIGAKQIRSHSRKGMTDRERRIDDRRHRSYNKKRMAKNAGNIFKNLGKAAKALVTGKNAGKYIARSRKSALKTARNATNLVTSYSGHTGKRTKTKAWIEKQLYGNKKGTYSADWNPRHYKARGVVNGR